MSGGLLHSAQSLLATVLALARTRLELFGTELHEQLNRLFYLFIGAVAVLLLAALGAAFAALALLASLPAEQRAAAAALVAAAFLAMAFAAAWALRRFSMDQPRALEASVAELERDRRALQP